MEQQFSMQIKKVFLVPHPTPYIPSSGRYRSFGRWTSMVLWLAYCPGWTEAPGEDPISDFAAKLSVITD